MLPVPNVVAFIVAATILIAIPGPSVLFVIGRALSVGRAAALFSVLGNALGVLTQAVAISLGLGALIQTSIVFFTIVKLIGAGFLVYLGIQAIRHRKRNTSGTPIVTRSWWRSLLAGALVGITNPKAAVFFLAILPQFVSVREGNVSLQLVILAGIFVTIGLICDSTWVIIATIARTWFARSPKRLETLTAGGGVALIGLGGVLALSGSKS
jgi:threonine/homoserine/homoserine lactone efflux protein